MEFDIQLAMRIDDPNADIGTERKAKDKRVNIFYYTIDTWTEHRKTYFEGRPDGTWTWSADVTKWGGCNGLLHYDYLVETP